MFVLASLFCQFLDLLTLYKPLLICLTVYDWAQTILDTNCGGTHQTVQTCSSLKPSHWTEAAKNLAPDFEHIGALHAICLVNELAVGPWCTVCPVLLLHLNKLHWSLHISSFQFLFQQLGMLVSFVRSHIRPYMDEIVTLMRVSTIFKPAFYCQEGWIVFLSLSNVTVPMKCRILCIWSNICILKEHVFETVISIITSTCSKSSSQVLQVPELFYAPGFCALITFRNIVSARRFCSS